jgi:hypothetical protein
MDIIGEQGKRLMNHRQRSLDRGLQNSYIFQGESVAPSAFKGFVECPNATVVEGFQGNEESETEPDVPTLLTGIQGQIADIGESATEYKGIKSMKEERQAKETSDAQLFEIMQANSIQQATIAIGVLGMIILGYHLMR